jgi:magnesium chelatase family protein
MSTLRARNRGPITLTGHARTLRLNGLDAEIVDVRAVAKRVPRSGGWDKRIKVVGLPASVNMKSVRRIAAALSMYYQEPAAEITVNITPELSADDQGADIAIAIAILKASGFIADDLSGYAFIGGLDVTGRTLPVPRISAIAAGLQDSIALIVPADDNHIGMIGKYKNIPMLAAKSLRSVIDWCGGNGGLSQVVAPKRKIESLHGIPDFADIVGQPLMRLAAEVAAAGQHATLYSGVAGSGKSTIAKALLGICPPLTPGERIDLCHIAAANGIPEPKSRPFRAPHHKSSAEALLGGGSQGRISLGEVTLAHRGVLFLDELPEFRHDVLEALREPMQEGHIAISRAQKKITLPAEFMLIAAMNPCPCGQHDGDKNEHCTCSHAEVNKYQRRLSGPLLDRFDMIVDAKRVTISEIANAPKAESSAEIRERVIAARNRQSARYGDDRVLNSRIPISQTDHMNILSAAMSHAQHTAEDAQMSMRSFHKLLQVSRTVADLADSDVVASGHVDIASTLV